MSDRISIIVSTYKRKESLARLLESFSRLRSSCPLEFIIVDSDSGDGTDEVVKAWIPCVPDAVVLYHALPERVPLARSRNIGISLSTGNLIAFTDDDCTVDPAWAERLYQRLAGSAGMAGVGGKVLPRGNDLYSRYFTVFRVLEPPDHINTVIGASCMFRKEPVAEAGGFDEYFTRLGGEEIALCMKLWVAGYRFGFEESAVVCHDYRRGFLPFVRTFYRDGYGERMIYENDPSRYLRFMQYPEQVYDHLGFRHPYLFPFFFIARMAAGVCRQYPLLGTRGVSRKDRVLLSGLYACAQVSYHFGRGTFTGSFFRKMRNHLKTDPDPAHATTPHVR